MRVPMPRIVALDKVWDRAPHNAFTDLVRFRASWFLAFREGASHMLCEGRIRVLASADGRRWESAALIAEEGIDLRDPHFSIDGSTGELELVMGGTRVVEGKSVGRRPRVARSADGVAWSANVPVLAEGDWLWRVERRGDEGFGVSYRLPRKNFWTVHLCRSVAGSPWTDVAELPVRGKPNEATVRLLPDGTMVALVRRESGDRKAWIGTSPAPYTEWSGSETREYLGGPNFIALPDGRLLAAGRVSKRGTPATALLDMTLPRTGRAPDAQADAGGLRRLLELPSAGDCSYPGLVYEDGRLHVSYYSSHEGKAAIYLAKIDLEPAPSGRGPVTEAP